MAQNTPTIETPASAPNGAPKSGKVRVTFANSPLLMHPDVALLQIPTQTSEEYEALREDIAKHKKINDEIVMSKDVDGKEYIVDGWHRGNIAEEIGLVRGKEYRVKFIPWSDAADYAVSASRRRNLTSGQLVTIGLRYMDVEAEAAKRRQATSMRVTNLAKSANAPEVIEVEYKELAKGGTIADTFSGDTIATTSKSANSKIRGMFEFAEKNYTAVDGSIGSRIVAYEVVDLEPFRAAGGVVTNYVSRLDQLKDQPELGFDGLLVNLKDGESGDITTKVLQGPPVIFAPTQAEDEADKKKSKGKKASEEVAKRIGGGLSARALEMAKRIQKEDPEAYARIEKDENQPGTQMPETINSAYMRLVNKAKSESGADKLGKDGLADPNAFTMDEFVEAHPLYTQMQGNEVFITAVKGWFLTVSALQSLGRGLQQAKLRNAGRKDIFAKQTNIIANIPHPYLWEKNDDAEGGYTYTQTKPKPEIIKPTPEQKAAAKKAEAVATKGKPNPKPEPKAKAKAKGAVSEISGEDSGEADAPDDGNGEEYTPEPENNGAEEDYSGEGAANFSGDDAENGSGDEDYANEEGAETVGIVMDNND